MPDELGPFPGLYNDGSATCKSGQGYKKGRDKRTRTTGREKRSNERESPHPEGQPTMESVVSQPEREKKKEKMGKLVEREMRVESKLL